MTAVLRNRRLMSAAYALAALFVFSVWVWGADTDMMAVNGDSRSTLDGLIYGSAHNPFVQRALVPILTRTINGAIPEQVRSAFRDKLSAIPKVQQEAERLGWDLNFITEYIVAFAIAFAALLIFPFILRRLFALLYITDAGILNVVPFAALFCLPPFFYVGTHYIYDFPALLFFSLGLLLMLRRRWTLYYAVFAVGCLNKETMILLALPLVLLYFRVLPRRQMFGHLAAHLVVFAAIKGALMHAFAGNAGGALEFHLFGNIENMLRPYTLESLLCAVVVGVLFWYDFGSKHPVLRTSAWLLVPFGLLMFCFAWMNEARDAYEVFPVCVLLMAHTVAFSLLKFPYRLADILNTTHSGTFSHERISHGSGAYAGDTET